MSKKPQEKLDIGERHILKLIARDSDLEGWCKISEILFKSISEKLPSQLVQFEKLKIGGRARLTIAGKEVVNAMKYL